MLDAALSSDWSVVLLNKVQISSIVIVHTRDDIFQSSDEAEFYEAEEECQT